MNKTDNLHRAVDDAKDQAAAALENVRAQAIATADEVGRAARKTMQSAQGATEEVSRDAASKTKILRSRIGLYLCEQPLNIIILSVAAGILLSLVLLSFRMNRK